MGSFITYPSPNITIMFTLRRIRWGGNAECVGVVRNSYNILFRKSERKT
jgi:hypothetical protein